MDTMGALAPDHLVLRRARHEDLEVVLDLLSDGASYARRQGIEQWPRRFPEELIRAGIERGEVIVGTIDDVAVATLSLMWTDHASWGEVADDAGYVHRLAVSARHRGGSLGPRLLDWAQAETTRTGRDLLRLDCLAGNARLRRWYEALGFRHQGDREVCTAPGAASPTVEISLYQRSQV
jgi:ribosomal protein S18 acetylase RimI-like enzyme